MQELIKITKENRVDARELHGFLQVETRFNDWIVRQIDYYGFEEGLDYSTILRTEYRQTLKEYKLTVDMAKELCMVDRSEIGKKARRYFIECERMVNELYDILVGTRDPFLLERRLSIHRGDGPDFLTDGCDMTEEEYEKVFGKMRVKGGIA